MFFYAGNRAKIPRSHNLLTEADRLPESDMQLSQRHGAAPNFCGGLGYGKQRTDSSTIYFYTKNLVTKIH